MLTLAIVKGWAESLGKAIAEAESVAVTVAEDVAKVAEPLIEDGAQVAELVDPAHAPLYALVARIAAEANIELAKVHAGQETASQALLDLIPDALAAWRVSRHPAGLIGN